MLLCAMEPQEIAYHSHTDDAALYYIDSGATGHYIDNINALHNYAPFETPCTIKTASNCHIQALGAGTLKFITMNNGREIRGKLDNIYYISDTGARLISIGKLFSQGWEPHLNQNGFALHDAKGNLVLHVPMKDNTYTVKLRTIYPDLSLYMQEEGDELTNDELYGQLELKYGSPKVAFTAGEAKPVILYDWHQRMGHHSMKTIVNIANSTITGITLSNSPSDIPKLDTCTLCALTKVKCTPFKDGWTCTAEPLEVIHGDLVGPMLVESVSRKKYGMVLMDNYSRASWVLFLRAKSNTPIEFEKWVNLMEKGMGWNVRTVMFNNAGELAAGRMRELCDK